MTIPIQKLNTPLAVIAVVIMSALIAATMFVTPAFALKRFFNCMTAIVNKTGKLSLSDVNSCYDKKFHSSSSSHATKSKSIDTSITTNNNLH